MFGDINANRYLATVDFIELRPIEDKSRHSEAISIN